MKLNELYESLAGTAGMPQSKFIKEIYKRLVTPEEAEMLLALPATLSEFAQKFHIGKSAAKQKLDEFVAKGVAMNRERAGGMTYCNPAHPIQMHDSTSFAAFYKILPADKEVLELWRRFRETEWFEYVRMMENAGIMGSRVIPLPYSIEDTPGMLPYEDIRAILRDAPSIILTDCMCRSLRVNEGECDKPPKTCLHLSPSTTKYLLDNNLGRKISVDEACQICENAAKSGLCPTVNSGGPNVAFICLCCSDCCVMLRPLIKYGYNFVAKSRYQCSINYDLCSVCGLCVDRCQFGAINMIKPTNSKESIISVDVGKCYGCGSCIVGCPDKALVLKLVRPVEHIPMMPGTTALDDLEAASTE